jgi:hypothetical protein
MAIIRTKREHNYTVVSNKVYDKNQLSWQAMGLLGYLLTKPDNWKVMVAELVNVTKDTKKPTGSNGVYSIINELKEKGFISVRKNSDGSTDYTVYDEPIQHPNQANPNQANPNQANPNQAEPTLVNTDIQQVLNITKDGEEEGAGNTASVSEKNTNNVFGDFQITDDWEPKDKAAFDAKLRRSQIPSLGDKRIKDALIEFTGYWSARGDTQTQAMWEHKFFQSLMRLKAKGELGAAKQDPSHKRFETRTADGMPVMTKKQAAELRPLGKF